jgi:F-type H+-transporting ATPase subunit alpha
VISITGGQIFLRPTLQRYIRPAINAGISVSESALRRRPRSSKRSRAASAPTWRSTANCRLAIRLRPRRGHPAARPRPRHRAAEAEPVLAAADLADAASLFAVNKGFMDDIDVKKVLAFESGMHTFLKSSHATLLKKMEDSRELDKDAEADLTNAVTAFKKSFS